jgi:hypothetical protein
MLQVNNERSTVIQENKDYISEYDLSKEGLESIVQFNRGDWFGADVIRLISNADADNLVLLEQIYPDRVKAVQRYRGW